MKRATAFLLAVCFLLQPLGKLWVYISFKLNQEAIARTLCVQRETEDNCCQGKCYLEKQLKKADEQHQKQLSLLLKTTDPAIFYVPPSALLRLVFLSGNEKAISHYRAFYPSPQPGKTLKPPEVA